MRQVCTLLMMAFGTWALATAQACAQDAPDAKEQQNDQLTVFQHPDDTWWWVSGQANIIFQAHPSFRALYSGPNSMHDFAEHATSQVFTLYTGAQLTSTTEILFDLESSGGRGISDALGLAGFTNLDVVRNPLLGRTPYIARGFIHQVIPLSKDSSKADRDPLHVLRELPERRLEFRFGKMSVVDFFDLNSAGTDSHLQFLNWTIDNSGGYDYAADTRGYSVGAMAEYQERSWGVRFGEFVMPTVANGIDYDWNLRNSRAENAEFELRRSVVRQHHGALRLLSYVNHGNMGSYREAISAFLAGVDSIPDVTRHRHPGTIKYGFGVNFEQELTSAIRVFGRFGWNEGAHESFAYTEVNQTVELGGDMEGDRWKRKHDRVGFALVTNGISRDHQEYLRLGGLGFLLGDGKLTYGPETIAEAYYTAHVWRGVFAAFDLQHINNPGYNRDRGPIVVPGLRLHVDF